MYLYGKNSVIQRLKVNPKSINKIFISEDFDDNLVAGFVKKAGIRYSRLTYRQLLKIKHNKHLQGIIAEIDNFSYTPFKELIDKSLSENLTPIFLDNLTDPQNLGAIIRTAACLGGFTIVIPEHDSCKITDAVLHVASGGENYVPISIAGNTSKAIQAAKKAGFWATGAMAETGQDIRRTKLTFPLCLVMGSEGKGIRPGVMKHIDFKITLPMQGIRLSFNVAIATALFAYEISKQKQTTDKR